MLILPLYINVFSIKNRYLTSEDRNIVFWKHYDFIYLALVSALVKLNPSNWSHAYLLGEGSDINKK